MQYNLLVTDKNTYSSSCNNDIDETLDNVLISSSLSTRKEVLWRRIVFCFINAKIQKKCGWGNVSVFSLLWFKAHLHWVKAKVNFFFDLPRCSIWTLNCIPYEPTRKRCHFCFSININKPFAGHRSIYCKQNDS